jgi:hypothetical protein
MRRYGMIVMAVVFVLALSVTAVAQYAAQDAAQETQTAPSTPTQDRMVMGTVVSISEASLVVQTTEGDRMIFVRDASSNIPPVVTAGTSVHVVYDAPSPGILHVSRVEVNVSGSDTKMDNAQSATGTTSSTSARTSSSQTGAGTETMPRTASSLSLIGLVGILALAGGFTIRMAARR